MNNLSNEDYKNILALISRASITGQEAVGTALLQQKIAKLLEPEAPKEEEKK